MKVLSIDTEVKRPSKTPYEAAQRFKRANAPKNRHSKDLNLCANVDYYLEHGKLPNDVDMAKIKGKGEAYTRRRDR